MGSGDASGIKEGMYLLRVVLPDRPGSLGSVASALGAAQADITAVEIVEKGDGFVIDDFMLSIPAGNRPDTLVTACAGLPGVEVQWVSFYPDNWGLNADLDVLEEMVSDPSHSEELLANAVPATFHCSWALVLDRRTGAIEHRSRLAPPGALDLSVLGDLDVAHVTTVGAGWLDGWGENELALAPFRDEHTIIIGRPGPEFRRSELLRLRLLAQMAGDHDLAEPAHAGPFEVPAMHGGAQ